MQQIMRGATQHGQAHGEIHDMSLNLPSGANFLRAKILWELALNIAGNKTIPYGGNRDMCIVVGSGAGERFMPSLRIATGSANLVHEVIRGGLDMAFINPSAMLTQAYRGVGMFATSLPVRIIASYPSLDHFVIAIRSATGLTSLADVKQARYPLQLSLREDPTHSTRILVDQLLALHGFSLDDLKSWGGCIHPAGPPRDIRRLNGLRDGTLDAVFDEGIRGWFPVALAAGFMPITLDDIIFTQLAVLGWRRVIIQAERFPGLDSDHACIDFSGWPLYASAELPDAVAYEVCDAFAVRQDEMPWEDSTFQGLAQIFNQTAATPMDVPLHPGAASWIHEHIA
jgi:TRAP-type uncharacterized transport system substrate-binding protein